VTITGGPAELEIKEMPRHKKNPAVGTKRTVYASEIIIDQADAQSFAIGEEVSHCGVGFWGTHCIFRKTQTLTWLHWALHRSL
jgi:glutamyl-tRNA synthetase